LLLRPLPSRYLARLDRYAVPTLKHLEKHRPSALAHCFNERRLTGAILLLLTVLSLLIPLPFSNIPAAIVTIVIELAYIEHDGLLLSITLLAGE
jgi:hypothetical protein